MISIASIKRVQHPAVVKRRHVPRPRPRRYFVFAGEAGSCLGGMQDFYGAYGSIDAARSAVPPDTDWAEVAIVRDNTLVVVLSGQRDGATWDWRNLDAEARVTPRSVA